MSSADFERLEEDMQRNIRPLSPVASKGLQNLQTWSTAHFGMTKTGREATLLCGSAC